MVARRVRLKLVADPGRVVGVMNLDRVKTSADELCQNQRLSRHPWVCHRSYPVCAVDPLQHIDWRRPDARNESRLSCRKVAIECLLHRRDVTGRHKRSRYHGATHGRAGAAHRRGDEGIDVDHCAELSESRANLADPFDPTRPLCLEKARKPNVGGLDEVSQNVHVVPVVHGRNLDAIHELDARGVSGVARLRQSCNRIVVRNAHDGDTYSCHTPDQIRWREPAIGRHRVEMEIDHEVVGFRLC